MHPVIHSLSIYVDARLDRLDRGRPPPTRVKPEEMLLGGYVKMAMNSRPLLGLVYCTYFIPPSLLPSALNKQPTFSPFLRCDAPLKEHGQCQRH
jgi:hypothetical protein